MANPFNFPGVMPNLAQAAQQYGPYLAQAYQYYTDRQKRYKPYNFSTINKDNKRQYRKLSVACGENKFIDYNILMKCVEDSGTTYVTHINDIPTGDTADSRTCKRVIMTGMQIRGMIVAGVSQTAPHHCGIAVVLDKTPRGALPSMANMFTTNNNPKQLNSAPFASRFRTLIRRQMWITGDGNSIVDANHVGSSFNIYRKLNIPCEWQTEDTTGGYQYMIRNALFFAVLGDSASNDDTNARVDINVRIYFKDVE